MSGIAVTKPLGYTTFWSEPEKLGYSKWCCGRVNGVTNQKQGLLLLRAKTKISRKRKRLSLPLPLPLPYLILQLWSLTGHDLLASMEVIHHGHNPLELAASMAMICLSSSSQHSWLPAARGRDIAMSTICSSLSHPWPFELEALIAMTPQHPLPLTAWIRGTTASVGRVVQGTGVMVDDGGER